MTELGVVEETVRLMQSYRQLGRMGSSSSHAVPKRCATGKTDGVHSTMSCIHSMQVESFKTFRTNYWQDKESYHERAVPSCLHILR